MSGWPGEGWVGIAATAGWGLAEVVETCRGWNPIDGDREGKIIILG